MNTNIGIKQQQITEEIYSLFQPVEGLNSVYYGKVRNGKTYAATADIIELLQRGEIVYANWQIDLEDFDERSSFKIALVRFFFGKKYFYKFKKENFHYFHPDEIDIDLLGRLVGVHLFIDEGQWIFNSHIREKAEDKEALAKRRLILHGGHYCRSLNVITQRPVNLFKDIRSQINVWYKCEKRLHIGRFILFQRWEFQDMKDDVPDEELSSGRPKTYIASKKIFNAYNTHGMRGKDAIEQRSLFEVYETTRLERFKLVLSFILPRGRRLSAPRGKVTKQGINNIQPQLDEIKRRLYDFKDIKEAMMSKDVET